MVVFFAAAALLVFWVVFIALVKHERGYVGVSEATRQRLLFRLAMANLATAIGEQFIPTLRTLNDQMVKFNEAWQRASGRQ